MEFKPRQPLPKPNAEQNVANDVFKEITNDIVENPEFVSYPRGMEVRENLNGSYTVPLGSYVDLIDRKVNIPFMFSEASWVTSGSNLTSEVSKYMKGYAQYSDDGTFMNGAYGPMVVDQLPYITSSLEKDQYSRQCYANIWRPRPGESKDIPCTVGMQFFIRDEFLYMTSTMRSNDAVFGYTYDIFTFSMVAKSVQLLLRKRGIDVELGDLTVNAGSLHVYDRHYKDVARWQGSTKRDDNIRYLVEKINFVDSYEELVRKLADLAFLASELKKDNSY